MGFRSFIDRDNHKWEIRPVSREEWEFTPIGENPGSARGVPPPGYETDPYELSKEEILRLFDRSTPRRARQVKNPFGDG